jgi:hypothetical protein
MELQHRSSGNKKNSKENLLSHALPNKAVMDFCNEVENREREQFDLLLENFNGDRGSTI